MADAMFSGWAVRTLSAHHPAFDPYASHHAGRFGWWGMRPSTPRHPLHKDGPPRSSGTSGIRLP
jgi:glycogen debranching enzyme